MPRPSWSRVARKARQRINQTIGQQYGKKRTDKKHPAEPKNPVRSETRRIRGSLASEPILVFVDFKTDPKSRHTVNAARKHRIFAKRRAHVFQNQIVESVVFKRLNPIARFFGKNVEALALRESHDEVESITRIRADQRITG